MHYAAAFIWVCTADLHLYVTYRSDVASCILLRPRLCVILQLGDIDMDMPTFAATPVISVTHVLSPVMSISHASPVIPDTSVTCVLCQQPDDMYMEASTHTVTPPILPRPVTCILSRTTRSVTPSVTCSSSGSWTTLTWRCRPRPRS